ncbi:KPN_02809 family neutral zinc metallopeptidase [Microbacterium sp. A84]|uniref:KPN_02809 family neutral zinc metallopeptidase n=1 Tax=Microbacterium sp. A84 TaxID=3450715 RepID=UPI003F437A46
MTFNPDADISGHKTRRPGRTVAVAGGGIGLIGIIALIAGPLLGIDLSAFVGGGTQGGESSSEESTLLACESGEDANTQDDCRMAGAQLMLDEYWTKHVEGYTPPQLYVFHGQTSTQCGTASNSVGPFYCPPEHGVYIDPDFFQIMRQQFEASAGNFAQLYIVGHEWGHHIQNITGTMDAYPNNGSGPDSNSVRTELQADCYAGAWLADATTLTDPEGRPYIETPTEAEITDALNAAFTVGDDHIQEQSGFNNPESWTHGSSDQRQRWFASGYANGLDSCDTFAVSADQLG